MSSPWPMPGELSVTFMWAHSELAVSSNSSLGNFHQKSNMTFARLSPALPHPKKPSPLGPIPAVPLTLLASNWKIRSVRIQHIHLHVLLGIQLCIFCIIPWIPRNLSFRYILSHEKRFQTMLWCLNARVNLHQRWKQTRFRICFHLWCELTNTMNVTEWQVSWTSWCVKPDWHSFCLTAELFSVWC